MADQKEKTGHIYNEKQRTPQNKQQWQQDFRKSSYIMGTLLLLLIIVIMYSVISPYYLMNNDTRDQETLSSRKIRGFSIENLMKESQIDDSIDIHGILCMGYGVKCCIELYFTHNTNIELQAEAGPKTRFTQLQGKYSHNNITGTWECAPTEIVSWNVLIRGDAPAQWTGNITNHMLSTGRIGVSRDEILYTTQTHGQILDPSTIYGEEDTNGDWVRTWDFQIVRETARVRISISFTATNLIVPEVRVSPQNVNVQEGVNSLELKCGTRLDLPPESQLVWTKNKLFLGSVTDGLNSVVIHRGQYGDVKWAKKEFIFSLNNPSPKDSGIYQCCVSTLMNYRKCEIVNFSVWSSAEQVCTGFQFKPSVPFQINHFQSKPLLRNGAFKTIVWTFNVTNWISIL